MTVPAPGQDNPQELFSARAQKVRAAISSAYHLSVEGGMVEHRARNAAEAFDGIVSERVSLLAALEAATRERDGYAGYGEILESLTVRAEAAERERDAARENVRVRESTQIPMIPVGAQRTMESLEARAVAAEQKQRVFESLATATREWGEDWKERAEAAEQALEAARDALRRLYEEVTSSWDDDDIYADSSYAQHGGVVRASTLAQARSALDASASTENTP